MTTSQSLASLLKSARDIMRKDKGLNGDLDRLPMLTWVMFLKFLEDLELQREEESKLSGKRFKPASNLLIAGVIGLQNGRHHRGRTPRLPQPGGNHAAEQQERPGLFRYLRTLTSSNGIIAATSLPPSFEASRTA
jgi:type I restriction enzyme M protein